MKVGQLCVYLPPFSSDYAGVCSALFDLDGMVVIHDASCCSRNYVSFDEPRWFGNKRPIFCSGLREIDAVLGDDEKLIRKVLDAAESIKPKFIALLGSPVPTIIGSDMKGIAFEIENRSGIPCFGFETTGFSYYNRGVSDAMIKLAQRYCKQSTDRISRSVNILGLSALDFSDNSNADDICSIFENENYSVLCRFMMGATLESISEAPKASVNVVVAQSGMNLAKWMEQTYNIPYVAATPIGISGVSPVLNAVTDATRDGKSRILRAGEPKEGGLLILGEQLFSNALRNVLTESFEIRGITVGTLFGQDALLSEPFDIDIQEEKQILVLLNSGKYSVLIADPVMEQLTLDREIAFFALPHVAVSSKLYWHKYKTFIGEEMEATIVEIAEYYNK